ncbi:mitochondrial fission regulator 2-like isoform X2 [Ischnura elegans]|uniref:mitochondrial fission regulator 2-like isoform X2 n=1 Tax=Ischnura elegans TaxID=197161 RepID=UPI001ED86CBC|nr:mitochondrial fission regulator 2-like isoform X2 [Ischnura elegans]
MELVEILCDLLSDLINDFLFELNRGLFNTIINRMAVRPSKKFGRHRSLVRWIGTALPLKPCRRTYSSIFVAENKFGSYPSYRVPAQSTPYDGSGDFETWRELKSDAPDVISSLKFSTPKDGIVDKNVPKEVSVEKFAALEEQVLQLQAEISKILNAQLLKPLQDSNVADRHNGMQVRVDIERSPRRHSASAVSTPNGSSAPPPPPPPPPLPPMPVFSMTTKPLARSQSLNEQINRLSRKPSSDHSKQYSSTLPRNMGDVLKDLGSVKLRHVERSPGGTPLRRRPLSPPRNDPAALLAAALRRRFAHMRPDDSSPDHSKVINSSPQKSFDGMEQSSFTLSPQAINNLGTLKI